MDSWEPRSTELTTEEEDAAASGRERDCGRERRNTESREEWKVPTTTL